MKATAAPSILSHRGGTHTGFQETRWTLVLRASSGSREALEELGNAYRPAVYSFFRRIGFSPEDAEDGTQQTLSRLLTESALAKVAPRNGRFRSFLCACARNEASHLREQASALKRAAVRTSSFETIQEEQRDFLLPSILPPAEQVFDRAFGELIIERALARLRTEYRRLNKEHLIDLLVPFLKAGLERGDHGTLAQRLGISEVNARVTFSRFKSSFEEHVREEVRQVVGSEADVDGELRYLVEAWLSESPPKGQE